MKAVAGVSCACCGKKLVDPERRLYSRWTRNHYCSDVGECAQRSARRKKKAA